MSARILVTGGAGFIGSAVVRQYLLETDAAVVNVDKLGYGADIRSLQGVEDASRYVFEQVDICERPEMERVFQEYRPDAVVHLAAESHVDHSIRDATEFLQTNIVGTYSLLEVVRAYWEKLSSGRQADFRFLHVSTDEVYGDLDRDEAAFTEASPYAPNSPYAATKASSDHLVRAWHRTYGLPVLITHCSNNYGPWQAADKLIPRMIGNALNREMLPVYGDGENIRDWLYVEDHARALRQVLAEGEHGRTYDIGGGCERSNLEVVRSICAQLDCLAPDPAGPYGRLIEFVTDRPGHDRRYAIDASRIRKELGWRPQEAFEMGLEKTVRWYLERAGGGRANFSMEAR